MFAVSTYEEIIEKEKQVENQEIVVFLFVKPNSPNEYNIIKEFEYIHYNSSEFCSIYAIGYTNDSEALRVGTYKRIEHLLGTDWFFSAKEFVEFKNMLEQRIKWRYSGETEILILQNNPGKQDPLNFQNYVAIDVNKGLKEGYMDSFQAFMESLVRSSRNNVTTKHLTKDLRKSRISIKDIVCSSIEESKNVPISVKRIIKNRIFYKTTRNFN